MKTNYWLMAIPLALLSACQPIRPNAEPLQNIVLEATVLETTTLSTSSTEQQYPDIVTATLTLKDNGRFDVAVTVSSPYDSPQRYADAWRLIAPDGTILGERILLHDHATEQPFTRTLNDVLIPSDMLTVTVEGRDQFYGYGGKTIVATVPDQSEN